MPKSPPLLLSGFRLNAGIFDVGVSRPIEGKAFAHKPCGNGNAVCSPASGKPGACSHRSDIESLERLIGLHVERMRQTAAVPTGEKSMGVSNAPTAKGKEAARGLKQATAQEERKIEAAKGSDLKKGEKRFEERSKSSDGKSAGAKQR